MRRLRFIADVVSVSQAEGANNRPARRAIMGERLARIDAEIMPLLMGGFVGQSGRG
jgi:hypothetical protein